MIDRCFFLSCADQVFIRERPGRIICAAPRQSLLAVLRYDAANGLHFLADQEKIVSRLASNLARALPAGN